MQVGRQVKQASKPQCFKQPPRDSPPIEGRLHHALKVLKEVF